MVRQLLHAAIAAVSVACAALSGAFATIVNLGFAFDGSGSVGSAGFALQRSGLAAALASIPTSGPVQYRVGVVMFASGVTTVVAPTIVTSANIASIQSAVMSVTFPSGSTNTAGGIDRIVSDFAAAGALASETSLINITTDGIPNSQTAAIASRNAALAAGWDGLSAECIIICTSATSSGSVNLLALASPGPAAFVTNVADLPNPLSQAFVLRVLTFEDYAPAIRAKITRIVDDTGGGGVIPVPGALPLFMSAMAAAAMFRRRRRAAA